MDGVKNPRKPEHNLPFPRVFIPLLLGAILLFTSGCVTLQDPEASQEYRAQVVGSFAPGQTAGQSFTVRRPRLNGIQVWLRPAPEQDSLSGRITFTLYPSVHDRYPLSTFTVDASYISQNGTLRIPIPPQDNPPEGNYYLEFSSDASTVQVMGRDEDAYPQGEFYQNGRPAAADASFRTTYEYGTAAVLEDLSRVSGALWLVLPLAALLWVPGALLLKAARLGDKLDWGERTAISTAISAAAVPLVMLWTSTAGIRWSQPAVIAAGALLAAAYLWQSRRRSAIPSMSPGDVSTRLGFQAFSRLKPHFALRSFSRVQFDWISLGLAAVFLFTLGVRLAMVRDLAAPPWVDSIHHALITRLIVEQGGYPTSYAPYLDIETAHYHAGYHSLVAAFHWLSGLEIPSAMLLLGQVLNAFMVIAVYLFTTTLTGDRFAGLAAALIAGVFTPMPAYYTSWGRYTQLAGLLILPAGLALTVRLLEAKQRQRLPLLALSALTWAGVFLIHYRVAAFLALLLIPILLVRGVRNIQLKTGWKPDAGAFGWLCATACLAVGLTLPWWPEMLSTLLIPKLNWGSGEIPWFNDFSWGYLTSAYGRYTLWLAAAGMLVSIIRKHPVALILPAWTALMFLLANLGALGLPGGSFVNNTSVEITLFFPIAALGGTAVSRGLRVVEDRIPASRRPWARWSLVPLGIALALLGARSLLPILNPSTLMFREADHAAMRWIEENIPARETVVINSFSWGYGLYAGSDGGYWIAPSAGRATMPPPVLYGFVNQAGKSQQISNTARQIVELSRQPQALFEFLQKNDLQYLYLGRKGGSLSPRVLSASPLFETLYENQGTWVFGLCQECALSASGNDPAR